MKLNEKGNILILRMLNSVPFREERIKRTQDIAENAAAEIRDSNEVRFSHVNRISTFFFHRENGENYLWCINSLLHSSKRKWTEK